MKTKTRTFYNIYPDTKSKDLMKPNGLIPYTLVHDFNYLATIVTYDNNDNYNDPNIKGVNVDFLKKIFNNPILDGCMYLIKNAKKIDILHTFFWKKENYFWFFIYKLFNKNGKIYVTVDADERIKRNEMINKGIKGKIKIFLLSKCNLISTETRDTYNWLKQNWYPNIKYIPYGVLPPKEKITYENKENVIITVGRIGTYQKANEILLEGFKKAYPNIKNWKLKLIGPIEEDFHSYIDNFYKENPKLKKVVEFTGPIYNRDELNNEYNKAKIFCLTSRYESFGLVLSEAASRGCYLISSDIAPAKDLTDDGKYGSIFKMEDSDDLAKKIIEVCNQEKKLNKNCANIQKFINENFTWTKVCEKTLKYLGEINEDKYK